MAIKCSQTICLVAHDLPVRLVGAKISLALMLRSLNLPFQWASTCIKTFLVFLYLELHFTNHPYNVHIAAHLAALTAHQQQQCCRRSSSLRRYLSSSTPSSLRFLFLTFQSTAILTMSHDSHTNHDLQKFPS